MADQAKSKVVASGPGNRPIAVALLELLSARGRSAERERALRASGVGSASAGFASAPQWLSPEAIGAMFSAAAIDPSVARTVGHRLVEPDATGLLLYGLGLATPEKAYRRVQSLLPRDDPNALWSVDEMGTHRATLRFESARNASSAMGSSSPSRNVDGAQSSLCAVRRGMLESIPALYGLLPAQVRERTCVVQGNAYCQYEVSWTRTARLGLLLGGYAGAMLGLAAIGLSAPVGTAMMPGPLITWVALLSTICGAALGRGVDLSRQLSAVAGARRGQLALFDQVDDALASKLDALARAEAQLEGASESPRPILRGSSSGGTDQEIRDRAEAVARAAQQIHIAAGDLERNLESIPISTGSAGMAASDRREPGEGIDDRRGLVRDIRESAARILEIDADGEEPRRSVDLGNLIGRAIAVLGPSLPSDVKIEFETKGDLPPIECEPVQIEQVVIQLVRNAVQASESQSGMSRVHVSLARNAAGIELVVEDEGEGVESEMLDEVFDPFFGDRSAGTQTSFGLPVCYRIVERHGGELQIETENRQGTRVSVHLPEHRPEENAHD